MSSAKWNPFPDVAPASSRCGIVDSGFAGNLHCGWKAAATLKETPEEPAAATVQLATDRNLNLVPASSVQDTRRGSVSPKIGQVGAFIATHG